MTGTPRPWNTKKRRLGRAVTPCAPVAHRPLVAGALVRICLLLVGVGGYPVSLSAQGYSQMEIGAQGASLTLIDPISSAEEKGGFGARVTYNVSPILAWDAEGDFFPSMSLPGPQRGGRAILALLGPKAVGAGRELDSSLKPVPV